VIVMVANVTSPEVRRMHADYPGMVGNLYSPGPGWWATPLADYALDNGRFTQGEAWSAAHLFELYGRAAKHGTAPRWVLVPDVVGRWYDTLMEWTRWAPAIQALGWPLAMAVQDGAEPHHVHNSWPRPDVVFVGGSTEWKWRTFQTWCSEFDRVHVGRVNSPREGWRCYKAGAESIDGTGWMRTTRQRRGLWRLLEAMTTGKRPAPETLFGCEETAA
jgi:hypothetical protein